MEEGVSLVIGAGPAGLAAALELAQRGKRPLLCERDGQVGGLSKTIEHKGYRFDLGGHRFFTKNADVLALWHSLLPNDFLTRPRLSRIYYRGHFFQYPLRIGNALAGLGPLASLHVAGSFLWSQLFPRRPEASFEDWIVNRFGHKLYSIFFKTYSEKVWGIPCTELSADWAAQRIRNLNLARALLGALKLGGRRSVASLIETFEYPRLGPGQMYETLCQRTQEKGARLRLNTRVTGLEHDGRKITAAILQNGSETERLPVENVISTMPLTELAQILAPAAPEEVLAAARALRYRSFLTVNLVLDIPEVLPDTWVYIHAPEITSGRLQLFRNWSPAMVPEAGHSSVGLEYFAFEDSALWKLPDADLLKLAGEDLLKLGLRATVLDGFVARSPKAYPMYDPGYLERVAQLRTWLDRFANLACAGRYGQFRYNNMDHSILTGLLAGRRLCGEAVDPWTVNEEAEYHEETQRPRASSTETIKK